MKKKRFKCKQVSVLGVATARSGHELFKWLKSIGCHCDTLPFFCFSAIFSHCVESIAEITYLETSKSLSCIRQSLNIVSWHSITFGFLRRQERIQLAHGGNPQGMFRRGCAHATHVRHGRTQLQLTQ